MVRIDPRTGIEKMFVNSMWVPTLEAMAIQEDNLLDPHAGKSTAEFKQRAKMYGVSLDWKKNKHRWRKKIK